jgi:hypothetical protein
MLAEDVRAALDAAAPVVVEIPAERPAAEAATDGKSKKA